MDLSKKSWLAILGRGGSSIAIAGGERYAVRLDSVPYLVKVSRCRSPLPVGLRSSLVRLPAPPRDPPAPTSRHMHMHLSLHTMIANL